MIWKSYALWRDGVSAVNPTADTHDTEEAARAVCEGVHYPLMTWVNEVDEHGRVLPYRSTRIKTGTFTLDSLVGRRLDILKYSDRDGEVIVAKDINTDEGFVIKMSTVPESVGNDPNA